MCMIICTVSCLTSSIWLLIDPFDVSFELALDRLASNEVIVLTEEFDKLGRISVSSSGTAALPVHLRVGSSLSSSLSRSCINCSGLGGRFGEASPSALGGGASLIGSPWAFFGNAKIEIGALALRTASFQHRLSANPFCPKRHPYICPFFINLQLSAF